jgi:pyridoxine 4-dehydrogenase
MPRTITVAGTEVARIGLGTNRLTSTPDNQAFLREAVRSGVGMVDTAHLYTGGDSERTIGEALPPEPGGVVIATKGGYNGTGSPAELRAQIEQSLESLRTDVIDLYYLHRVDPDTPLEKSLGAIAEFVDSGAIKEVGISKVDVEEIEAARKVVPIAAVQNEYNLGVRGYDDVVDHCEENGIAFLPYYPLRGGGAAGLDEIASAHDATPHQIALAWMLHRSPVVLPIPGTLSISHLRENLSALEIELSTDQYEALA